MDRLFGGMLGDVALELEGREFGPGSVIHGRFAFKLHRPKECRQACVQLRADEEWMGYSQRNSYDDEDCDHHHHHHHHHRDRGQLERQSRQLFEQTVVLSGQGSYQQGVHPFRLQVPRNAPPTTTQNDSAPGLGEMMMNAAIDYALDSRSSYSRGSTIEWSVRGWLDIPWGSDPVAREVIIVSPYAAPRYEPVYAPPPPPAPAPTPARAAARFCMKCGTQARKPGARFCHACGNAIC